MLKWFNKKKKTSKDLIENVLNEAEKLNAFDEPEEAPEGWGSEPVLEEVQEQTEEEEESGAQEEAAAQEDFSETVAQPEEEPIETVDYIEDTVQEKKPKKGFFARLKEGLTKTRDAIFGRLDSVFSAFQSVDEELFEELEETLIMADIGVDTSVYMIEELRTRAKEKHITDPAELKIELKNVISEILMGQDSVCHLEDSPSVIMVIGVNGVGKTTSIGKMAHYYQSQGKKVILAAADTFRAAAIDQLQIWAQRAEVEIVKHKEGSDPSAVVFDAIQAAKARGADIVICDTAGRLHNKKNLMEELAKTARVIERETGKPASEVLLVLDASTGQNALIQAKEFANAAHITGVVLTKLDGTAKGGVIIALSREQNIGVKFIGVGEGIDDLQEFDPKEFAKALFPENEE
uniref:Signal recognition particle receptor FtsY n=1 Tax=Congzhengia minquanensis TaxID=2763657 RepID=A0A926DPW1_9FIRM|nr:signal recognition particle-docking protein FtsY [Congzhengia minquanensis]MBC8541169.1 signal recognition particle-docking protein FtsY [Congzhengia minquanensis]